MGQDLRGRQFVAVARAGFLLDLPGVPLLPILLLRHHFELYHFPLEVILALQVQLLRQDFVILVAE